MADNNIDDWQDIPLQAEVDDWEEIPLEETQEFVESEGVEFTPQSAIGRADVRLTQDVLESTGAGKAIERGLTKVGEAVKGSEVAEKLGKGVEGLASETLSKVGRLDRPDIKLLSDKPDLYNQIKKQPGELPKKMAGVAEELGEKGKSATKNLDLMLDSDKAGMKREEFLGKVKERVSDKRMEPNPKRVQQAEQAQKKLDKVQKNITKQQTKYESKLSQLENKLEEFKTIQKEYKEAPDKLLEAKIMKDKELQAVNDTIDKLKDEKFEYDDPTASKQINREIELQNREKRKLGENLKDLTNEEKIERTKSKKLAKDYEKKVKEVQDEIKNLKGQNKKDVDTLKKMLKEAEEGAEKFKLRGEGMAEDTRKAFEGLERTVDYTSEMKGKDLTVAKEYADKFYGKDGDSVRKAVRDILRERSPEAAKAMDTASESIADRKNLLKMLGLSDMEIREAGLTETKAVLPKEASSKLASAMFTEAGAEGAEVTIKEQLKNALQRAGKSELIDELELNRIAKLAVADADVVDAYLAAKGLSPSSVKRILSDIGTKAQEFGAKALGATKKALDTPLGKAASKLGRGAAKTLPFVAAGLDYAEAGELGIESELGKAAYAGLEQLNPLPVSTGQMVQAMSEQAPMRQAAARRAMASNFGLQEEPTKEITTKRLQDRESAQQTVYDLSKLGTGASRDYAARLQNVLDGATTKQEYNRKLGMMATEPGFRKLLKKLRGEEDVDGQEN